MVQVATLLVISVRKAVIKQITSTINQSGQSDITIKPSAIQSDNPDT